jgi:hypothetical protein
MVNNPWLSLVKDKSGDDGSSSWIITMVGLSSSQAARLSVNVTLGERGVDAAEHANWRDPSEQEEQGALTVFSTIAN